VGLGHAQAKGVKRMRKYMLDHASDYIDAHRHFANKRARMTDRERDEIDEVRLRLMCATSMCVRVRTRALHARRHTRAPVHIPHSLARSRR
jgi:hypothetical protein